VSVVEKIIPRKAFLRLFGDRTGQPEDFYDVYADECKEINEWRKSEFDQIIDELSLAKIDLRDKSVLDVSGGPGYVGFQLQKVCKRVVVTEFSSKSSEAMSQHFGLETKKFDYTKDRLRDIIDEQFDIIMIRSSIIFCSDLDTLILDLKRILKKNGHILIETILPTYGEVFWWQQLEYKFPIIYSQEVIEKLFYKHGLKLVVSYRDYGSYLGVKDRSYQDNSKKWFTWLVEYPMILAYLACNFFKKPAIDTTMNHKMLTQIWTADILFEHQSSAKNFEQSEKFKSKTFGFKYNGYLRDSDIKWFS
jgi:ubiquinone/menaquinone biosynthesis C-methylase UbiE